MEVDSPTPPPSANGSATAPKVSRGQRACTFCRAAKMKCVGSDNGEQQCQRCARAGAECVFEKHRRGRKPGSKLSEASKLLRRLEKGLNTAKQSNKSKEEPETYTLSGLNGVPMKHPSRRGSSGDDYESSQGSNGGNDDMDDSPDRNVAEDLFPAKLIGDEKKRHSSFFRTVLDPTSEEADPYPQAPRVVDTPLDPITAGIVTESQSIAIFDLVFLRLNPFINLFDPFLHSFQYVRSKSPFLFTTLLTAGCKFFQPEQYKACKKLAQELAGRAFIEGWKSVETVQAFACLTYWHDPNDNRTWTYIGYACRMAVELRLNRQAPKIGETQMQLRERRNCERTYLIIFVHDRSLSMQTGRLWMLPEDDLVRRSPKWHEAGGEHIRPEDVIVSAFVQLRRIAADTTDLLATNERPQTGTVPINFEVVLRNCNAKLHQWVDWENEMKRARGEPFHYAFVRIFSQYTKVFLNSFGIQQSVDMISRGGPSLNTLSVCYESAKQVLTIVSKDLQDMGMLRYCQDSITIMSAYCAVFLIKLISDDHTLAGLPESAKDEVHSLIQQTADAYQATSSSLSSTSASAAMHARFLRLILRKEVFRPRQHERYPNIPVDNNINLSTVQNPAQGLMPFDLEAFRFPASPIMPPQPMDFVDLSGRQSLGETSYAGSLNGHPNRSMSGISVQEQDSHYWKRMFTELGFGSGHGEQLQGTNAPGLAPNPYNSVPQGNGAMGYNPNYQHMHYAPNYQR